MSMLRVLWRDMTWKVLPHVQRTSVRCTSGWIPAFIVFSVPPSLKLRRTGPPSPRLPPAAKAEGDKSADGSACEGLLTRQVQEPFSGVPATDQQPARQPRQGRE